MKLHQQTKKYFSNDEDLGGYWERHFVIYPTSALRRVGITERTYLFGGVFYDWTFPFGLYDADAVNLIIMKSFRTENTAFSHVLPNSYILVLHKLDKNGKKCGKLYVDMLFYSFVKLTKTELETLF